METVSDFFVQIYDMLGSHTLIVIGLAFFIGIMALGALFAKCDLPFIATFVPFWNGVVFLKIMGRPWYHIFFLLIPLFNIYFVIKVFIELCHCFGKKSTIDYILIFVFNGLYILNLGLSQTAVYQGPVYKTAKSGQAAVAA